MRYEATIDARNLPTYLALAASVSVVLWLSMVYTICFFVFFGPLLGWACWAVINDRKWHIRIDDGVIKWDALFGRERILRVSEITEIDLWHDEGDIKLSFRFKNGKQRQFYVPPETRDAFVAAIVEENPSITVRGPGSSWHRM